MQFYVGESVRSVHSVSQSVSQSAQRQLSQPVSQSAQSVSQSASQSQSAQSVSQSVSQPVSSQSASQSVSAVSVQSVSQTLPGSSGHPRFFGSSEQILEHQLSSGAIAMPSEDDNVSLCSELEEVVKCAICWELPTSPKVLSCQHSFCLRCLYPSYLADLQERHHSRDRIQCPLCRQLCVVPKKGLGFLPADHRTNAVTDLVQKRRYQQVGITDTYRGERKKTCQVCKVNHKYTTADYFCLTCGVLLCSKCNGSHTNNKLYDNHIEVELFIPDSSNLYCVDHPKENIQFYCGDCERPICNACTHTKHATHRSTKFIRSVDADVGLVTYLRRFVADRQREITEHTKEITELRQMSKRDKEIIAEELAQVRDQISRLRERETELEARLQIHDTVEGRLDDLEATMVTSTGSLSQLDDVITGSTTPLRQYREYRINEPSLQSIQKAFTAVELPVRDMELMRTQYGKMVASYDENDDDVDGKHYFLDIDGDVINSGVRTLWRKSQTLYDVQFLRDGSRRMVCTAQLQDWRLSVLGFAEGDPEELPPILSRYSDCQCRLVVNASTGSICLTHKKKTDGWRLPFSVIDPDGRTSTGTIRTSPEQNSLCAVVVTRYRDVIFPFMGYGFPPKSTALRCHSPGGAYRWYRDVSIGSGSGQLYSPHYVTVDSLDRILVSDHYGCKVSIFDNMGHHLLSFPRITLPEDADGNDLLNINLPKPAGICVDSKANIYVAFPTHDVVSLFTPNGQFIRHVVSTKGKARGISICEDRYLAVSTFEDGIWLYDLMPEMETMRQDGCREGGDDGKLKDEDLDNDEKMTKVIDSSSDDEGDHGSCDYDSASDSADESSTVNTWINDISETKNRRDTIATEETTLVSDSAKKDITLAIDNVFEESILATDSFSGESILATDSDTKESMLASDGASEESIVISDSDSEEIMPASDNAIEYATVTGDTKTDDSANRSDSASTSGSVNGQCTSDSAITSDSASTSGNVNRSDSVTLYEGIVISLDTKRETEDTLTEDTLTEDTDSVTTNDSQKQDTGNTRITLKTYDADTCDIATEEDAMCLATQSSDTAHDTLVNVGVTTEDTLTGNSVTIGETTHNDDVATDGTMSKNVVIIWDTKSSSNVTVVNIVTNDSVTSERTSTDNSVSTQDTMTRDSVVMDETDLASTVMTADALSQIIVTPDDTTTVNDVTQEDAITDNDATAEDIITDSDGIIEDPESNNAVAAEESVSTDSVPVHNTPRDGMVTQSDTTTNESGAIHNTVTNLSVTTTGVTIHDSSTAHTVKSQDTVTY
ncbi:hypothetical protein LSH36_939g00028 [Paralvinella palmiformis]|uniref:Uncharacterized protein n=1 Tax=Paralvinella palmiformis TaxID=53620 RepID=A0AAD9MSV1_9ANNE|nr:hypothetical protein LSH36_939g00028 [Paralvinella palmiformis]